MRRRSLFISILLIVFLIGAMLYGGGAYLLHVSVDPGASVYRHPHSVHDTMTRLYPHLHPWLDSLESRHALRDTTITASDGTPLHALYVRSSRPSNRIALLVHGYQDAAGRMLHIGYFYARNLHANLLLPDLRYHGRTPGNFIGMGWRDRLDALQWAHIAPSLFRIPPDSARLVVHGISMGAATTMMLSGERHLPPYLKALVEDCGYTSAWDIFRSELKVRYHLPSFPLMNIANALCCHRYGWSFREASALEAVRRCKLPMFFIHGGNDTFVPTAMVYPLYAAKPAPKAIWIAPNSRHAMSFHDHPAEYEQRVGHFLCRYAW